MLLKDELQIANVADHIDHMSRYRSHVCRRIIFLFRSFTPSTNASAPHSSRADIRGLMFGLNDDLSRMEAKMCISNR